LRLPREGQGGMERMPSKKEGSAEALRRRPRAERVIKKGGHALRTFPRLEPARPGQKDDEA